MRLTFTERRSALREPFAIARTVFDVAAVVEVRIDHGEASGFGEAAPDDRYGEDIASTIEHLRAAADLLPGDPFDLQGIRGALGELPSRPAADAAIDIALHDLRGKLARQPAWQMLGVSRSGPATNATIWLEDPQAMAVRAARATASGFMRLKVKLGGRDGHDLERVTEIRKASPLPVLVDVNEHWSFDEAVELIPQLASLGVTAVEQPLEADDPRAPALKRASVLPIFADEACSGVDDVDRCVESVHGVNIKLAKAGGLTAALALADRAERAGLRLMVGTMLESGLGVAAASLVAGRCEYADLDANLLLEADPWPGVEFRGGAQVLGHGWGLGVHRATAVDPTAEVEVAPPSQRS